MTLRVGLVHYGLDRQTGGIGRYTVELATALAQQGVAVQPLWAGQRPAGAPGISLPGAYLLPGLLTVGQAGIALYARRLGLDLVHDPTGAMALLLARAPRVLTIHDAIPYVYPQTSTRLDWLIYRVWLPLAVRAASAVITDSAHSREDILTHLPVAPERVAVVPLAADRRFRPLPLAQVEPVLRHYGLQRPYILYVGALESRKNLPRLLEAYALLRAWSPRWRLMIVGAAKWKFSPIFDAVQRLGLEGHVDFTGYVADEHLPALYAGADLFAFPSLYEGFGLPVLEAMACGAPVVTSNTSSLPEVAGDAALLVDPTDVRQIAQAMWLVLSQPALAAELRARGLARAAQFTWKRTARETIAVYERVLGDGKR
jgi:glycosyltransferase involved in cell wall biosynthesis